MGKFSNKLQVCKYVVNVYDIVVIRGAGEIYIGKFVGEDMSVVLRGLIREMLVVEDTKSREVDRIEGTPAGLEEPLTWLKLAYLENNTAALANMKNALKKAGGIFEDAIEYLQKPAGSKQISDRTFRRIFYEAMEGAENALEWIRVHCSEEAETPVKRAPKDEEK